MAFYAKVSRKFNIEKLTKPTEILSTESYNDILIRSLYQADKTGLIYTDSTKEFLKKYIVAKSNIPYKLASYYERPFFNGMLDAYADHRPIVLSPDMIWLLISQGFSHHVNNNSESLRNLFVNFEGKMTLIARNDSLNLLDPDSPWESIFPDFTKQIATQTGQELINALTCDFTTTNAISKVASEITILDALKSYFEYRSMACSCGIPEITLEGTPQDWAKVKQKAIYLRKYKLDWWIDQLIPVLNEFERASKGHINKKFWRNMVNYHEGGGCRPNNPDYVKGWIIKFFPYDKYKNRNEFNESFKYKDLPSEITKTDFNHIDVSPDGSVVETPLVMWAGFVGLEQDTTTFSLKPTIGWMIQRKELNSLSKKENRNDTIQLNVKEIPDAILNLNTIKTLVVNFKNKISIPDRMFKINIGYLELNGVISEEEKITISKQFPNTVLKVNGVNLSINNSH
jgi:hypothetical protein